MGRRAWTSHSLDTRLKQAAQCVPDFNRNISRTLSTVTGNFTPWQIIVSTLTVVYAMRNADKLVGLGGEF